MSVESDLKKWLSMGFLLTRLPKMNLDTIWICQKNRFGTIYLKSVLINFFYCCKYSVEIVFTSKDGVVITTLWNIWLLEGWVHGLRNSLLTIVAKHSLLEKDCIKFLFMFCTTSKSFYEVVVVNWAHSCSRHDKRFKFKGHGGFYFKSAITQNCQ